MLKAKTKGLFIELSEYAILAARTSSLEPPFTIEAIEEFPAGLNAETEKALAQMVNLRKGQFLPVICGAYPVNRFVRRASLDSPSKARDQEHLENFIRSQFRIEPKTSALRILDATSGVPVDFAKMPPREIILAGASMEEWTTLQADLVSHSCYPERLELGTLATIGALRNYKAFREDPSPVLMLELTAENAEVFILSGEGLDVARPVPFGLRSMFPLVQEELALKDEASAEKLFFSDTFDFTEMAPVLLKKLLREIQASAGFYEVQTGQSISQIFMGLLPRGLGWIGSSLARTLAVEILQPVYEEWLESLDIAIGPDVELSNRGARWFGLFSLMGNLDPKPKEPLPPTTHAAQEKQG